MKKNKHKLETENEKVKKRCQWLRPKVTGAGLVDEFGEEYSSREQRQRGAQHSPGMGTRRETECISRGRRTGRHRPTQTGGKS